MIVTTLLNIAIFQGIVLGIIILKSPIFKSKATKYLAYAIFSLSVLLLNLVFEIAETYNKIPFIEILDNLDLELAFPVFILLFIIHQVDHPIKHSKSILWFFIPFLFFASLNIFSGLDAIAHLYKIPDSIRRIIEDLNLIEFSISIIFIPGVLIYGYTFIKWSKSIQEKKWLTHLWLLVFMLLALWSLSVILFMFLDFDIALVMQLLALFATFLIHWTVYSGIFKYRLAKDRQEIKILLNKLTLNQSVTEFSAPEVTNEKVVETFTQENIYFKKLENLCANQQIYKDSTLDREKVAEMLGISTGYVSQLVNTITGSNFTTYINRYRVEAVKEIILNPEFDNYSLLAIGLECGFSSKSTFHNAFKKITGTTPSAYRKQHK